MNLDSGAENLFNVKEETVIAGNQKLHSYLPHITIPDIDQDITEKVRTIQKLICTPIWPPNLGPNFLKIKFLKIEISSHTFSSKNLYQIRILQIPDNEIDYITEKGKIPKLSTLRCQINK